MSKSHHGQAYLEKTGALPASGPLPANFGSERNLTPEEEKEYLHDIAVAAGRRETMSASAPAAAGLRYDTGKVRLDLLPPEWEWALGQVMTAGALKYEPRNWEKGMAWSKVLGPMRRHIVTWLAGETYDAETGCHHLAMVAWNALALMVYQLRMIGEDNVFPVVPVRLEGVRKEKET